MWAGVLAAIGLAISFLAVRVDLPRYALGTFGLVAMLPCLYFGARDYTDSYRFRFRVSLIVGCFLTLFLLLSHLASCAV
jgi:hypothetical protein